MGQLVRDSRDVLEHISDLPPAFYQSLVDLLKHRNLLLGRLAILDCFFPEGTRLQGWAELNQLKLRGTTGALSSLGSICSSEGGDWGCKLEQYGLGSGETITQLGRLALFSHVAIFEENWKAHLRALSGEWAKAGEPVERLAGMLGEVEPLVSKLVARIFAGDLSVNAMTGLVDAMPKNWLQDNFLNDCTKIACVYNLDIPAGKDVTVNPFVRCVTCPHEEDVAEGRERAKNPAPILPKNQEESGDT